MSARTEEFHHAGRMVVLLTMREALALYDEIKALMLTPDSDVARAREMLQNQIAWLRDHHERKGVC